MKNHVNERVHNTHFMESHGSGTDPVGASFSLGKPSKHFQALRLYLSWHATGRNDPLDAPKGKRCGTPVTDHHIHLGRVDAAPYDLFRLEDVAFHWQPLEPMDQVAKRQPSVHQGAKDHISADSRVTIKMQVGHRSPSTKL